MLNVQRTLDFDAPRVKEIEHVEITTARPPPALVRPDRQLTYGGAHHWEWPKPDKNPDRITVDRIHDDMDGPSHRFVIERGDTVEVFRSRARLEVGEVTDISHHNQAVRVSFCEGSEGEWFAVEQIYPTPEETPRTAPKTSPCPQVITEANENPQEKFSKADRVPDGIHRTHSPHYALADFHAFRRAMADGTLTFETFLDHFERLLAAKDSFPADLNSQFNAKELVTQAYRLGCWDAKRNTKAQNAASIYRQILSAFVLEGTVSYSMGTTLEDAVISKVRSYTRQEFVDALAREHTEREKRDLALRDPQTFFEFRTFLQERGEDDLSDEQLARYDALHAEMTRDRRAAERKTSVSAFQSEELSGYELTIKEGYHDRRKCPLWIVQLTTRVERATFNELHRKAKMLGGWYSSFRKTDAGFQFLEQEKAERFAALLTGDVDRADVLAARKDRKEQSAAERLHDLAGTLAKRADETLEASNQALQNTARRADIQAGVRGRAYADAALARTMHSIAEALSRGEAKFLDGLRHKSQVETLDMLLRVATFARRRQARSPGDHTERQPNHLDVRYADYPYPTLYKRHLENAIVKCRTERGAKQAAERMAKRLRRETEDYVTFRGEHDIEALEDFVRRMKTLGQDTEVFGWALEKHQRLQRAGITDIHELRCGLREYLEHRAESRGDDPVKVAERELIGSKLSGFFPTPAPVIERMLELAQIESHHSVLEPSCGKGDLLDAIKRHCPSTSVHAIELNRALADVLSAKGHAVEFGDFLEHRGAFGRILMNPPFESQADLIHIQHAFQQLAPGGRLVSVVSESPFFRVDNKSVAFRDWLEAVGAEVERLPDDAFQGAEAFRETGVRTRLITIIKDDQRTSDDNSDRIEA